jgi:hypothetical protein
MASDRVVMAREEWDCMAAQAARIRELEAENERLREALAGPDWGEQYLREMDERKRQGDRAHKWQVRAEALLGPYAISAALAVMQERKLNVRREDVADALAAAWRTAVGTDEEDRSATS